MYSNYSFLIYNENDCGNYPMDLLPLTEPDDKSLKILGSSYSSNLFLRTKTPIWRLFSIDKNDLKIPQSEIAFWFVNRKELFGQFLYSGEKVLGKISGELPTTDDETIWLDLTIGEEMLFDNPKTDKLVSVDEAAKWQYARRCKRLKTQSINLYNNHGLYHVEHMPGGTSK
ncbi:hypothetical protein HDF19_13215 [Mucilaginibacter sp. E4BP6]|uniref:hypothetical protein n=1 Tax=Mucilaginibacter sp. E4BP6 TaxID=2723089 RepID=UPI0015C8A1CE|nr:hypothetical protein [Mucilaginibacter sp. E4BP6]NYE64862.1 hypothetical protein [Mucilaginibacter sp. E4BP6]